MDGEVLDVFLKFVQNCDGSRIGSVAEQLLVVAHDFVVEELKSLCAVELENSITPRNVVRLFGLASRFKLESLKNAAALSLISILLESHHSGSVDVMVKIGLELAELTIEEHEHVDHHNA